MKNRIFIIIAGLCLMAAMTHAQQKASPYFQQQNDYTIHVQLDDQKHTLQGEVSIIYTNHAPQPLTEVWMHLWPNAYKDHRTALARQLLRNGSSRFYFSSEEEKGYIQQLDFKVNGDKVRWEVNVAHQDIARIVLSEPLAPGKTITISTPFLVKIPGDFSRMGHVGQSYQISQWYPKPAVFDQYGWHAMPYLDQGEFYSNFGKYDVYITLPENYVVGATGTIISEKEKLFMAEKIKETESMNGNYEKDASFPESAANLKTIHFQADQVHDFAWFADKRYHVRKGQAKLASGKIVDTYCYYINKDAQYWHKGVDFVTRAVEFYSEVVGEYPYPQASAVYGALSAGGGMEYPMITVIGDVSSERALDEVITHEVGHNWFYGILATNERDHPWMDEGFNSYVDHRYSRKYYGDVTLLGLPKFIRKSTNYEEGLLGYTIFADRHLDQPTSTTSELFTSLNYGLIAYEKTALATRMLQYALGTDTFDIALRNYYEQWKFKHPYPEDIKTSFEKSTGKNLDWFFDGLMKSNKTIDYAVLKATDSQGRLTVTIKNKGEVQSPVCIQCIKNKQITSTVWQPGFEGTATIATPFTDCDQIYLDKNAVTLDVDRRNNEYRLTSWFPKVAPLSLRLLPGIEHPEKTRLYWLPILGANNYDGLMAGVVLYNRTLPLRKFQWLANPLYSTLTNSLVGNAYAAYNWYPYNPKIRQIQLSGKLRSYHTNNNVFDSNNKPAFVFFRPAFTIRLFGQRNARNEHTIQAATTIVQQEIADFSNGGNYLGLRKDHIVLPQLSYQYKHPSPVHSHTFLSQLEYLPKRSSRFDQSYLKGTVTWNHFIAYQRNRYINWRIFAGYFFFNTAAKSNSYRAPSVLGALALSSQNFNDYSNSYNFLGRSETNNILAQQIAQRDGNMHFIATAPFSGLIGNSNQMIASTNLSIDLPFKMPQFIKPYADLGYFHQEGPLAPSLKDRILWQAGLQIELFEGQFRIFCPLIESSYLRSITKQRNSGYTGRIAFAFNFLQLNPVDELQNLFQ